VAARANNLMAGGPTADCGMTVSLLGLVAAGLAVALLVVIAVLLFRRND
jgi:hypothetical protein